MAHEIGVSERRGTKRGGRVDTEAARQPVGTKAAEICAWCNSPGTDRPAMGGVANICPYAHRRTEHMRIRHFACAYSACVHLVGPSRTDLLSEFREYFARQAQSYEAVYFCDMVPDFNKGM